MKFSRKNDSCNRAGSHFTHQVPDHDILVSISAKNEASLISTQRQKHLQWILANMTTINMKLLFIGMLR